MCVYSHTYTHLPPSSRTLMFTTKYAYKSPHIFCSFIGTWFSIFICVCLYSPMYACSNYQMLATFNIYVLVWRSIPYSGNPSSISIDTYVTVTVPIDVHLALPICLSFSSICIFMFLIHEYRYLNTHTHFSGENNRTIGRPKVNSVIIKLIN